MTGAQICRIRRKLGLTQARLATSMGVSHISVRFWECGYRNISKPNAAKLLALKRGAPVVCPTCNGKGTVS